jgi:heavy metal sensor kinase
VYFFAEQILDQRMETGLLSLLDDTIHAVSQAPVDGSRQAGSLEKTLQSVHNPGRSIWLLDSDGRVLAKKASSSEESLRLPERMSEAGERPRFYELDESGPDADDGCRGVFKRFADSAGVSYIAVVAQSTELISDQLDMLRDLFLLAVPFAVILAAAGGWFLARRSLAPIAAMAASARQITARNLEERLPVHNPDDEVGSLATTFNQVLDRLSAAFTQQRQFMADASHELRTPLSVMRTAAEVTLEQDHRQEPEYREALATVKQQARRLTGVVENMFALARADMGQLSPHRADLYLDDLVNEALRAASVLATHKEIRVEQDITSEAPYRGDEGLLRQMLLNLFDNAIKYTPPGGAMKVCLETRATEYAIQVTDTGPGIPGEDQHYIFDRFFRSDKARTGNSNEDGGAGLGLSIARSIAELHGGQLQLARSDSSGSTFIVRLPRR